MYRRGEGMRPPTGQKRRTLPEYLEAAEVEPLIRCAPNARAALIMTIQWRAGLRISEAVGIEARDLQLDGERPTLRVRAGKGAKSRLVPVHPELGAALRAALAFGSVRVGSIVPVSRSTAWRWTKQAQRKAEELGLIRSDRSIGTHTLRHSFARHCLANGVPINVVSRWLGHASLQTTLVYLEILPDPLGHIERVP